MTRKAIIGLIRAAALAAALFLAGGAVPFVGVLLMLFAPAPVLGYAVGRPGSFWRAALSVLLSGVLIAGAAGPVEAAGYAMTLGAATVIICYMIERQEPFERIVLVAAGAMIVSASAGLLWVTGSPAALAESVRHTVSNAIARSESLYQAVGMGAVVDDDTRNRLLDLTVRLSPAMAVLTAALMVLGNLALFWRWLGKERLNYQLFSGLTRWRAPDWSIWLFISTGFGMFVPLAPISAVAVDTFICVAAVYFCQGLAIMAFYFQMLAVPIALRGIIYFFTLLQPVLAALVCAVGVFDIWVDFRRLKPQSPEAGSFGDFF